MENEVQNTTTTVPTEKKGLSIASMVLGIVSIVGFCIHGSVALICAILAVVFGIIGKKKGGKGMAITGLILGIISLSIYIVIILMGATLFTAALAALN